MPDHDRAATDRMTSDQLLDVIRILEGDSLMRVLNHTTPQSLAPGVEMAPWSIAMGIIHRLDKAAVDYIIAYATPLQAAGFCSGKRLAARDIHLGPATVRLGFRFPFFLIDLLFRWLLVVKATQIVALAISLVYSMEPRVNLVPELLRFTSCPRLLSRTPWPVGC